MSGYYDSEDTVLSVRIFYRDGKINSLISDGLPAAIQTVRDDLLFLKFPLPKTENIRLDNRGWVQFYWTVHAGHVRVPPLPNPVLC